MKRFSAFIIGFVALISWTMPGAHAAFSDVSPSDNFYEAVQYVQKENIVTGFADGTFKPHEKLNRAQLITILSRALYRPDGGLTCGHFFDVPAASWFTPHVCEAFLRGLIAGYDDGSFQPARFLNLAEAAKIISIAFGAEQPKGGDVWYERFVQGLAGRNALPISLGAIDSEVTRAQAAEMIYRLHADVQNKPSKSFQEVVSSEPSNSTNVVDTNETTETETSEKQEEPKSEPQPEPKPETYSPPGGVADAVDQLMSLNFIPEAMFARAKNLIAQKPVSAEDYDVYSKDNLHLYILRENKNVQRAILLIEGETKPLAKHGFWRQMDGSSLKDLIIYSIRPGYDQEEVEAKDFPGALGNAIQYTYGGKIDLKAGVHATAQLTLRGVTEQVLSFMNYPTDNLYATIGRELPSLSWETGASAGVEKTKKGGNPADAFEATNYIEIMRSGLWSNPMDMERTTLTDATIYLDDGPVFGFWGVGTFDNEPFAMYYKGPLIRSKEPQDYVEAEIGFGAHTMSLAHYIKLMSIYNSRFPGAKFSFMGGVDATRDETLGGIFAGLDALPLEVVTVTNEKLKDYRFKSGDNFPGPEMFNMVVLGPLAQAKDGTRGPLALLKGTARLFGESFGTLDFRVDINGAKAKSSGSLGLDLGSAAGQDLGNLGGTLVLDAHADATKSAMTLAGVIDAGPLGGRGLSVNMKHDVFTFQSPSSCAFPFDINGAARVANLQTLKLSEIQFTPEALVPNPASLIECPEDIFMMVKDGVVYAFNGTKQLATMALDALPENDATKLGKEGIKFAEGAITAGGEELLNAASKVPGASELNALGQQGIDEAKKLAEKAAKEAAEAAKKAAEKAAKEAAKKAKEAAEAAAKAAREAAAQAEKAINEGVTQLNNFISNPAGTLKSIGGAISKVGSSIGSAFGFGGGGSSIPGFGWHGPYRPIKAIDVGASHNAHPKTGRLMAWFVSDTGYPLELEDLNGWRLNFWYRNSGLPGNFPGFIRIDADKDGYAAAVDKKGRLWTYNGTWRMTNTYATDVGIGGGKIWITSTEPQWAGYKIYRAPYSAGRTSFNWQYMNGAGTKIDVGSDGRAWALNNKYEVWEWDSGWYNRNGQAIDITVSAGNRAWVLSAADYNKNSGGGRIYTYERARNQNILGQNHHSPAHWAITAGFAHTIGSGYSHFVWAVNSNNDIFGGTGRP